MYNCMLLKLKDIASKYGQLIPIEGKLDIPFEIRRVYYITEVDKGASRGFHAHRNLHEVLVCLNGSVKVKVKTPDEERIIELKDNSEGLYIGPYIWIEMYDFSEGCVLLVLASEHYDENDYIRDYNIYLNEVKSKFRG